MAESKITLNPGTGVPTLNQEWNAQSFNGTFSPEGEGKYNVSQMVYPADLHDTQYGGNMVVFYINVANASKFEASGANESYDMTDMDIKRVRMLTEGIPETATGLTLAASAVNVIKYGAAGAAAGMYLGKEQYSDQIIDGVKVQGKGLKGFFGQTFSKAGYGALAGLAESASALGLGAAASIAGTTKREQKRLRSAIALHMPNNLSIRYSTHWSDTDTTAIAMPSAIGKAMGDVSAMADLAMTAPAYGGLSQNQFGDIASTYTGLAANPRKELVFKGVDFRTFQFDYKFFPRSSAEAKLVLNIINAFKFHMQPEYKDKNSFLYLYPSEFDIAYYTNNEENLNLHRHTSCVLIDMQVNYTPNGNFNAFPDGMPTQIDVTLTFKELALMSKELINKGF